MADAEDFEQEDVEIKRLFKKRSAARGQVTKISNKVENELRTTEGPDKQKLQVWLKQLKEKGDTLLDMDTTLHEYIPMNKLEDDILNSDDFQETVLIWTYKIEEALKQSDNLLSAATLNAFNRTANTNSTSTIISPNMGGSSFHQNLVNTQNSLPVISISNQTSGGAPTLTTTPTHTNIGTGMNSIMASLPKLEIPKFNGELENWSNFWNLFEPMIHNNCGISFIHKFSYLKSYLEGDVKNMFRGLDFSEANYNNAITLLKNRFGRKDVQIRAHINNLRHLDPIESSKDVVKLRRFFDECEIEVKSLQSYGVTADQDYGLILCPMLLDKLPEDINLEYTRRHEDDSNANLEQLLEFVRKEVESRERARAFRSTKAKDSGVTAQKQDAPGYRIKFNNAGNSNWRRSGPPRNESRVQNQFSAASLSTSSNPTCMFCKGTNHLSENCPISSVEERKSILKKTGHCYVCATGRHLAKFCKVRVKCEKCDRRHHVALCEGKANEGESRGETPLPPGTVPANATASNAVGSNNGVWPSAILLQTARAKAESSSKTERIRLLIDSGSHRTFILETLSRRLQLPVVGEIELELHTFGSNQGKRVTCRKVKLTVKSLTDPNQWVEVIALESPAINTAVFTVPGEDIRRALENKKLQMADYTNGNSTEDNGISLLIGSDYYWRVITGRIEKLNEDGLTALESIFGWVVQGPLEVSNQGGGQGMNTVSALNLIHTEVGESEEISRELRKFFDLESLGIIDSPIKIKPSEEKAKASFESTVKFEDGRYTVRLPWNKIPEDLSLNYLNAKRRLLSLSRRLKDDNYLLEEYRRIIEDYLKEGIIEPVEGEIEETEGPVYYLPHQPVVNRERSTTKVRIVCDASSHEKGKSSLNDCLHTGPHLNPDIFETLVKFRSHSVVITADVEKAFLQIRLHPEDRNAVRFLWFQEPINFEDTPKVITFRFTRVLFGASASPFLLAATVRHHANKYRERYPTTVQKIENETYVDDVTTGDENEEKAFKFAQEAKLIFKEANMNLRKFETNSEPLREMLMKGGFNVCPSEENSTKKVLGLSWDPKLDEFSYDVEEMMTAVSILDDSKRSVIKTSARLFDPLGLVAPFVIRIKILYQRIWQTGVKWDEPLPQELSKEWRDWCSELKFLSEIKIPRFYRSQCQEEISHTQLHSFSDASERAYGAALYVRYVTVTGKIVVSLVSSKTRVAPVKKVTVPRLELLGALLGARLATRVKAHFPVQEADIYYWSDSTIAIHWIKGSPEHWKPFVSNRVSEIQTLSDPIAWNHCPGKENPADYLSRGQGVEKLKANEAWWQGPTWLRQSKEFWIKSEEEPKLETVKEERRIIRTSTAQNAVGIEEKLEPIININDIEEIWRLLRVTAWVKRFTLRALKTTDKGSYLKAEELNEALVYWIKLAQKDYFREEWVSLRNKEELSTKSTIFTLKPFLDSDGVIRIGGRLQESDFTYETKHPILLPTDHRITKMLIMSAHREVMHSGTATTLTQIRERFWIPKARQVTKKVLNECLTCKKWRVKPAEVPWAPLPKDRITEAAPFVVTGVDFAGPIYIKATNGEKDKSYIALFTCGTTRAVHLELVSSLSTECFLLALRRFISRRGLISTIYSDNAKTFQKADRELVAVWKKLDEKKIGEFLGSRGIHWKFIIERAPWYGGFYERLVKTIKSALRKTLGNAFLNFEEMATVLSEAEATINSRPLTYLNNESTDPAPLTPAGLCCGHPAPGHFLIGRRITAIPYPRTLKDSSANELRKRWTYQQTVLNRLWNRWRHEYLLELKTAHQITRVKTGRELKSGDVVIITDEKVPRQLWRIARVEETHIGRDGHIRSCSLKLPSGTVIRRAVKLLCLLEVNE